MNPEEKAKELFDKINICIPINADFKDTGMVAFYKMERDHFATKKISLIAIDEILESFNPLEYYPEDLRVYWIDVKNEIEKL